MPRAAQFSQPDLAGINPMGWFFRLAKITDPHAMVHAASIVWWEFFADESRNWRSDEMDALLAEYRRIGGVDSRRLAEALVEIGWTPGQAAERARAVDKVEAKRVRRNNRVARKRKGE